MPPVPNPEKRQKGNYPLFGNVCLLTTGVLIRVRRLCQEGVLPGRFGQKRSFGFPLGYAGQRYCSRGDLPCFSAHLCPSKWPTGGTRSDRCFIIATLPPPADGVCDVVVDRTINNKTGSKPPLAKKGRIHEDAP